MFFFSNKRMCEENILQIDKNIRSKFMKEHEKISKYKKQLLEINISLNNEELKQKIRTNLLKVKDDLEDKITKLEEQTNLNFYLSETLTLLEKYKKILKKPIKINFMGKSKQNNTEKDELCKKYIDIASKYIDIKIKNKNKSISCNNCDNKKYFEIIDENIYICEKCCSEQMVIRHNSSFKDIDRVNISSQYMYDRKVHFKDGVNQYQGFYTFLIFNYIFKKLIENNHNALKLGNGGSWCRFDCKNSKS